MFKCCIDNGADIIISAQAFQWNSQLIGDAHIKFAPIVSL